MAGRRITYHPGGGANEITLGNDAEGEKVSGGRPEQRREVEAFHPTRGEYQLQFNRGGKVNTFTWRVDRDHGSVEDAVAFMRDHPDAVPHPLGQATGYLEDLGADGSVRYLLNATIPSVVCVEWDGQSTVFEYTAVGGAWADSPN